MVANDVYVVIWANYFTITIYCKKITHLNVRENVLLLVVELLRMNLGIVMHPVFCRIVFQA